MRLRKPHPASLDEVKISRAGADAVVEFREPGIAVTHLRLGGRLRSMSDGEILECFNQSLRDQAETARAGDHAALEIPPGRPQIEFFAPGRQWVPRGSVLRCVIDDSGPAGEAVVHVDDVELPLADFGKMLCTFSGWGMRICFVPEERLAEDPRIELGEPDD
jgi:hypothetical protein